MGSRGSFKNYEMGDFRFKENGRQYDTVSMIDNVKVLVKRGNTSVGAPFLAHSGGEQIYAVLQKGALKHIAFYSDHNQVKIIDMEHKHYGLKPHVHLNGNHSDNGIPITKEDMKLIKKLKTKLHIKE